MARALVKNAAKAAPEFFGEPGGRGNQFAHPINHTMTLSSKPRVLIADDERLIADTLATILNYGGFEARATYSGRSALQMAQEFQPNVLISDVLMADGNGLDAAFQMRGLLPELRVFLLSGQVAVSEMLGWSRARELGFVVLCKPVHPKDLITRLQKAMEQGVGSRE